MCERISTVKGTPVASQSSSNLLDNFAHAGISAVFSCLRSWPVSLMTKCHADG